MSQTNHPWSEEELEAQRTLANMAASNPHAPVPPTPKLQPQVSKIQVPKACLLHTPFSVPVEEQFQKINARLDDVIDAVAWLFIDTDACPEALKKDSELEKKVLELAKRYGYTLYQ
jgi:hypothetical protein